MAIVFENDAELRSVKANSSIIPEYSLSIMEDALYVAEAIEMADKACSECIGINELHVYESTGELIAYDEAEEGNGKWNLKSIKDSLIAWAKKLWEAVKSFFDKLVAKFGKVTDNLEKNIGAIDVDKLADDASFGEVYPFTELRNFSYYKFCDNAKEFAGKVKDLAMKEKSIDKENGRDYSEIKKAGEEVAAKVTGEDVENISAYRKELIAKLCGEKVKADKAWVKANLDVMKKDVKPDDTKKLIKGAYARSRKLIDGYMSDIKKLGGGNIEAYVACKPVFSQIVSCMNTANSALFQAFAKKRSQSATILAKVVIACNKTVKEDVEVAAPVDQQSVIESLFAF